MTATPVLPYAGPAAAWAPASALMFRTRAALAIALGVLSLVAFASCLGHGGPDFGKLPTITSADPRAEAELRKARELDEAGDTDAAIASYRRFITHRGDDPLVPVAQLALGRLLLKKGNNAAAKA